ncbi:aldehyde dehydrogenase family protein [Salibacterium salarium]|uniref:Aldehyde dehydrogenase n=1 Tax=Salibacterium salarium TaxID=284579 RepID=A0A428MZW9_9BACI|nr:aldehyde dehydrogenase family protein [Salibacterium salarium]RSL31668.1 aldehyde dehydrogenase family protein [Salibacterium salarium]
MALKAVAPAVQKTIDTYDETPAAAVNAVYERSHLAYQSWSKYSVEKRTSYLKRLRHILIDLQEEIADIISISTGKTKTDALTTEVMTAVDAIKHVEKEAPLILANEKVKTPLHFIGKTSYINRKPRGTVLIISPWNFPFQLALVPLIEALAAGNTVILKPSEETPMIGKLLQHLMSLLPDDVAQIVMGGKDLGGALTSEKPDYIHFTGSVSTGKHIQRQAADHLIPTTLELGGKDAMVVFNDAHIKRAAKAAVWGSFHHSGQVCLSIERVYVQSGIYNQFLTEVKRETAKIRQGQTEDSDIGSMTTTRQTNHVKRQVQDAVDKGAVIEAGRAPGDWKDDSPFIEPLILTSVNSDMDIMSDETFGPVMPIFSFHTEEEAVQLANSTSYGLGGSVFTSDIVKAERVTNHLVTGNVNINDVITSVANFNLPFGGVKNSGIGKYHGYEGIRSFCIETSVMADKGTSEDEITWYPSAGKYLLLKELTAGFWGRQRNWKSFIQTYMRLSKM